MNKEQAKKIIKKTFENSFDKDQFTFFIKNLLNNISKNSFVYNSAYIKENFRQHIKSLERIGKFSDGENNLDILIITLQKKTSLERARTMQRNFIAWYLNGSRGGNMKDAALVAYVSSNQSDWRFSLVKMDYKFEKTKKGNVKVKEDFTPAKRWSFLVGKNEKSHTAQSRLVKILSNDDDAPTLEELENAFDIESVTKEFFIKYRELFLRTKEALDEIVEKDQKIKKDFETKDVDSVNFAKKLLGQIVFLYFLQKKGWFGVGKDDDWGKGSKHFLRALFDKKHGKYNNFFNDILEPLFYEALRIDRSHDDGYYSRFDCKIPFLNGGLFDPIGDYDWVNTDIYLPNCLFSNSCTTKEGDEGDGILDVFDRYNFTVCEDEPLEKEVAIDPELLGKAYEKFNAIRPDNFDEFTKAIKSGKKGEEDKFNKNFGVYYTPREIVHYMCKQSLINYLYTQADEAKLLQTIKKQDIQDLIEVGEIIIEHETMVCIKQEKIKNGIQKSTDYTALLSDSIKMNALKIDQWLEGITVCDPAVGSGAFPVGMMNEIVRARNVLSVYLNDCKRNDYNFKRHCIEHSLYGVDIDYGAVEIAKLRLWLSLIVDEEDIKNIKPLPNLDYKIVCGNSLLSYPYKPRGLKQIEILKKSFFKETNPTRKNELRGQIDDAIYGLYRNTETSLGYKVTMDFKIHFSEVFHKKGGFDIVIANPPYVSTKGRDETDKVLLKKNYGFADDLYSHFYFKSIEILSDKKGHLCFISSKTFWTIQTKKNLRELFLKNSIIELYDTAKPFEAMVDTCVILVQKTKNHNNPMIIVKDGKTDLLNPKRYEVAANTYKNIPNNVFFIPTDFNMSVYNKYNVIVKSLMDKWWDKISTSRKITLNKIELEKYRNSLKPGDTSLLGLITEGGQGLATANNGKYIGVLDGTNQSGNIKKTRIQKLLNAILSEQIKELDHIKTKTDTELFLSDKSEQDIRCLFDKLKKKYGRDIFGQGWLYRIVKPEEIADVEKLTSDEKLNGIKNVKAFVPYDKGDKEGNRWYAPTPYYIDWSRDNVEFLKRNSGKKGQGMPVVRNPQFYFRNGFCWSDIHTVLIRSRLKTNGIHDVKSMSMFAFPNLASDKYIISLLNSHFISEYDFNFVNNTQTFQINDARQLPIIIPTKQQLKDFEQIFDKACLIQKDKFNKKISKQEADNRLKLVQSQIDQMVYKLYNLTEEEIKIVEGETS